MSYINYFNNLNMLFMSQNWDLAFYYFILYQIKSIIVQLNLSNNKRDK
jgi:hypothetical protein